MRVMHREREEGRKEGQEREGEQAEGGRFREDKEGGEARGR